MSSILENKNIAYLIIILLSFFRFIYLDQDVHSRMIEGIAQGDEVYYAYSAYDKYLEDNDKIVIDKNDIKFFKGFSLQNFPVTYLSLKVFGNNYYGLRISAVIFSLFSILLLYITSKKILLKKKDLSILLLLLLYSDFYFFIFSRFQTPQIYSIFILCLIFYVFLKEGISKKNKLIILAFLSVSAVLFYYLLNLYILAAFGIYLIIISVKEKNIRYILYSIYGTILSISLYLLLVYIIDESIIEYYIRTIEFNEHNSTSTTATSILSKIKKLIIGAVSIGTTNLFRFNPILLWGVITIFLSSTWNILKKKHNGLELFLLLIIIFGILQSFFVSSYPFKKWIVLIPVAFIGLSITLENLPNRKVLYTSSLVTILIHLYSLKINYAPEYWTAKDWGYYKNIEWYYIYSISLLLLIFIFGVFKSESLKNTKYIKLSISIAIFLFTIMEIDYFVIHKSSTYKEALIKFSSTIKNNKIIGGNSRGFTFYTDGEPILSPASFFKGHEDQSNKSLLKHLRNYKKSYRVIHIRKTMDSEYKEKSTVNLSGGNYIIIDKVYAPDSLFSIVLAKYTND
jgi:4-amino-4-deoxy-L-arabinose transferase-like glycosyltransferase